MSVTRQEVQDQLATRDPRQLERVLDVAEVWFPEGADADELARRLVNALWWRTHTPIGQAVLPYTLDDIVELYIRKLGPDIAPDISSGGGDVWRRLDLLCHKLMTSERLLSVDELPEPARKKLEKSVMLDVLGVTTAGGSAASRWAAKALLRWTSGPLWDLIKLIPRVGPILGSIRVGAGRVAMVSGPLGVTVALLTLNHTLGPNYDRALPLLLGINLVCKDSPANT